jgi:hypothetical protein
VSQYGPFVLLDNLWSGLRSLSDRKTTNPPTRWAELKMNDLAVSAAQALVQAMTTNAWNEVQSRISEIFKRHKSGERLNRELRATLAKLTVDSSNREHEIVRWALMLQTLTDSDDTAAVDLGLIYKYLTQITSDRGCSRVRQTGFASRDQYNVQGSLTVNQR